VAVSSELWLVLTGQVITVLGLGTVLAWMGKTIKAMKGTVEAQEKTIRAQAERMGSMETLLGTMGTVLSSTDEKNMLARLQAHKEFVEHERAADAKRLTAQFEEERKTLIKSEKDTVGTYAAPLMEALVYFAINTLPYVPPNRRQEFVGAVALPDDAAKLNGRIRAMLSDIANAAPDLSAGTTPTGLEGFGSARAWSDAIKAALRPAGEKQ
jgi:hypothetical protein